jgi:hypothetical protein
MPLFEITEVVRYRIYADDKDDAIEVLVNDDDPDQFFFAASDRSCVRPFSTSRSIISAFCRSQAPRFMVLAYTVDKREAKEIGENE